MTATTFHYRAVDRAGTKRTGSAVAATQAEALRNLTAQGLIPLDLRPATNAGSAATGPRRGLFPGRRAVRSRDVAHFTAQLAVLISARVPIADAVLSIAEQEPDPRLKAIAADVAARVEAGEPLADALAAHPAAFDDTYVETLRSGEKTGNLTATLDHLAETLERAQEATRAVKSALAYPLCVLGVLFIGVVFLVGYVVPKFADMYASRGVKLPWLTEQLRAAGHSVQSFWWAYLLAIALACFTLNRLWRSPAWRLRLEALTDTLPALATVLRGLAIGRFARVLGMSLASGLGLIESLHMAGNASGRALLKRDARALAERVRTGGRLADALPLCDDLTPFARRMIIAGETAGELPRMCGLIARHYDREASHLAKALMSLIEPLLIVTIALVVLVIALSIFLPMWNMVNLVS